MMSFVVSSDGGVPSGFEIVGAWPTTADTIGRTVESDALILIPPKIVMATSVAANIPARTLRGVLLIF
jgi:hypothetical protein